MPSCDPELAKLIIERFGDIGCEGPEAFLKKAGYTLSRGWAWGPKPGVTSLKDMTREEFEALLFLIHEWDYDQTIET